MPSRARVSGTPSRSRSRHPTPRWRRRWPTCTPRSSWTGEWRRTAPAIAAAQEVIAQKLKEFQTEAQRASSDFFLLSERLRDLEILSETVDGQLRVRHPRHAARRPLRAAAHEVGDHGRRPRTPPRRRLRGASREARYSPAQLSRGRRDDESPRRRPHPGDSPGEHAEGPAGGGQRGRGACSRVAAGSTRQHRIREPGFREPNPDGGQRSEGRREEPRHRQPRDFAGAVGQEGRARRCRPAAAAGSTLSSPCATP